ncbi:hypothetical protein QBC32DRAFT_185034, partial [Pseudoneurospora amorphoporcata]
NTLFHHPVFCNFPIAGQGAGPRSKQKGGNVLAFSSCGEPRPTALVYHPRRPGLLGETTLPSCEELLALQVTLISGKKNMEALLFLFISAAQHGSAPASALRSKPAVGAPFLARLALA